MSNQADTRRFSFLSLLFDGDEQMYHEQLLTSDQPQHQQAPAGQFRNTNSGDMFAGQALQTDLQTNFGHQYQQVAPGKYMGINSGKICPASVTTAQVNSSGTVANYAIHSFSKRDQQIASCTGQELSEAIKIVAAGSAEDLNGKTTFRENDEQKQSPLNSKKVWTEQSSENLCRNTMDSSGPASIDLKMTELSLEKCKNVVSDIIKKMEDKGDEIAPLLADTFNRDENSCYKNSWSGLCTLNFKNISRRLYENGYESVHDFVKEVQSMLKGVADQFVFSVEMISEARTVHDLFFEIMERTFENIDFRNARSEVEFPTSTFKTFLLGVKPSVRHVRKRSTNWAKFTNKDEGSN